jgi:hypothetical protein
LSCWKMAKALQKFSTLIESSMSSPNSTSTWDFFSLQQFIIIWWTQEKSGFVLVWYIKHVWAPHQVNLSLLDQEGTGPSMAWYTIRKSILKSLMHIAKSGGLHFNSVGCYRVRLGISIFFFFWQNYTGGGNFRFWMCKSDSVATYRVEGNSSCYRFTGWKN